MHQGAPPYLKRRCLRRGATLDSSPAPLREAAPSPSPGSLGTAGSWAPPRGSSRRSNLLRMWLKRWARLDGCAVPKPACGLGRLCIRVGRPPRRLLPRPGTRHLPGRQGGEALQGGRLLHQPEGLRTGERIAPARRAPRLSTRPEAGAGVRSWGGTMVCARLFRGTVADVRHASIDPAGGRRAAGVKAPPAGAGRPGAVRRNSQFVLRPTGCCWTPGRRCWRGTGGAAPSAAPGPVPEPSARVFDRPPLPPLADPGRPAR